MGLFGKKEKAICPVCGQEMNDGIFGDAKLVADGMICNKCEKMLRGEFDVEHWLVTRYEPGEFMKMGVKEESSDPLSHMTIAMIQELINERKEKQAEAVAELGGEYSSLLTIEEIEILAPKPLEVGLKRAKELKNKPAVRGMVQLGSFAKGDSVCIVGGDKTPVTLLDVVPCEGLFDLKSMLSSNMHKKDAGENINAWLILDTEKAPEKGDTIAKL